MKQPREDVAGTDRSGDDLLSLEDSAMPVREALIAMARHLSTATMVGSPAPIVERMSERIRKPQAGDLVVEASTVMYRGRRGRAGGDWYRGFGILLAHRTEWAHTDDEWAAGDQDEWGGERPLEDAWYVQYGPDPADVCRWLNCDFLVLPIHQHSWFPDDSFR